MAKAVSSLDRAFNVAEQNHSLEYIKVATFFANAKTFDPWERTSKLKEKRKMQFSFHYYSEFFVFNFIISCSLLSLNSSVFQKRIVKVLKCNWDQEAVALFRTLRGCQENNADSLKKSFFQLSLYLRYSFSHSLQQKKDMWNFIKILKRQERKC